MSSNRQLHFDVRQQILPDKIRREIQLRADREAETISVLYDIFDNAVGDLRVLDGLVQSVLLYCMTRGLPVRIHGNISASAAYNLHEFQRAWALWRPELYRQVDLIPDAVVAERPRSDKVLQAFSGGVDANFTLISNKFLHRERGGYDVSAALLVHGFDVEYDNSVEFGILAGRLRKALDGVGVELKIVRTNSRALKLQSWMDSCASQLTACLHQFSNHYGRALIGSGSPYNELCLPIGSNPISDPLLSGDLMTITHDGAGYSRTEKVEAINKFPELVQHLRVCWQGGRQYENCGSCEKCLRTRLNFAAAGNDQPACFPARLKTSMLRTLRARSTVQIAELESILAYAKRRELYYPWLKTLRRQIMFSRLLMPLEKSLWLQQSKRRLRDLRSRI
jgi:hypothetical protein